jgi:hypothetical protein
MKRIDLSSSGIFMARPFQLESVIPRREFAAYLRKETPSISGKMFEIGGVFGDLKIFRCRRALSSLFNLKGS